MLLLPRASLARPHLLLTSDHAISFCMRCVCLQALVRRKIMHEVDADEDEEDIKEDRAEVEAIVAQKLSVKFPSRGQRTSIPIVRSKSIMRQAKSLNVIKAIARMTVSAQRSATNSRSSLRSFSKKASTQDVPVEGSGSSKTPALPPPGTDIAALSVTQTAAAQPDAEGAVHHGVRSLAAVIKVMETEEIPFV